MREAGGGFTVVAERYGLPLAEVRPGLVNGCLYFRMIGIGEGDKPSKTPPPWVMKVMTRVHPELRRRNRIATRAWQERQWRQEVDSWFDRERATVVAANLDLQRVELGALDDSALIEHVQALLAHFGTQARRNVETHGGDLVPTGDFLAHCRRWGIDDAEATALLRGSSPATVETATLLAPVGKAIAGSGATPDSIEAIRQLGDEARKAVDAWHELHGWRIITTDDIDRPTLAERPNLLLAALLASANAPADVTAPDVDATRAKVPPSERDLFDSLLAEARYGMRQRDDSVGVRWNWSAGLLRRALLECARRLVAARRTRTRRPRVRAHAHRARTTPDGRYRPDRSRGRGPCGVPGSSRSLARTRPPRLRRRAATIRRLPARTGPGDRGHLHGDGSRRPHERTVRGRPSWDRHRHEPVPRHCASLDQRRRRARSARAR